MFSIGEFSKITGLTVKTLRFYHEQGILIPTHVETGTGYRFYAESKIETARIITSLRDLEFSLAEITEILSKHDDDGEILEYLESQKMRIQERMREDRKIVRLLDNIIQQQTEASGKMKSATQRVEEKSIDSLLVASIAMTGKYSDCGNGFSKIGRKFGRQICGKPMMFHHDNEYRADDAHFEVVMPIKKGQSTNEIEVKEAPGGRCLSLMHYGPYEELKRSYEIILSYAKEQELKYSIPTREVYHKGPGIIFRGNPKKYVTEIQLVLEH